MFLNQTLDVRMAEGADSDVRVLTLLEHLYFTGRDGTEYRARSGTTTDGISDPRLVTNILQPHGRHAWVGYLHDAAYHHTLEEKNAEGEWVAANVDKNKADSLLREALQAQGCSEFLRIQIYEAVHFRGGRAWEEDLALPIPPTVP